MRTIETARLLLRPWRADDLDDVARLWANPAVVRYTWGQPPTRERVAAESERMLTVWRRHGFGPWAAIEKAGGCWIGKLGLDLLDDWPDAHKIEVGWVLHQAWWGRGLATEGALVGVRYAFEELGLERLISVTLPANAASRRVMEKAGLAYQGTRPRRGTEVVWYAIDRARPYSSLSNGAARTSSQPGPSPAGWWTLVNCRRRR